MNITFFSAKPYDQTFFEKANQAHNFKLRFLESALDPTTSQLACQDDVVCVFVNDHVDEAVLSNLATCGVRHIALRCSGFNNVDIATAERLGIVVSRVPAYSPNAVAEHTLALILSLNRRLSRASNRVRDGNFSLDGLLGFDLAGKTAGVIGTGEIGAVVCKILRGFSMEVIAYDIAPSPTCVELGVTYVELDELLKRSDIVTLHCPLVEATKHLINERTLSMMKRGCMLINTSRGALVDTRAVIDGLKSRQIGSLGIDVYEEESGLFFQDFSGEIINDDIFARLLTFPNVLVTGHQAFFTTEALTQIAETTLANVAELEETGTCGNAVGTG